MCVKKCHASLSQSLGVSRGVVCLQTDDTMYTCNKVLSDVKEKPSKNLDCKKSKIVKNGTSLKFSNAIISRDHRDCTVTQSEYIKKINELGIKNASTADFFAEKAWGANRATVCWPDIVYGFSAASRITITEVKYLKVLNKAIGLMIKTKFKDYDSSFSNLIQFSLLSSWTPALLPTTILHLSWNHSHVDRCTWPS